MNTILVTGGCGFIGCNFILYMMEKYEYNIINLDKLTYAAVGKQALDVLHDRYTFVQGDVCNMAIVDSLVQKADIIVHFAAESHVDRSINNAAEFIQTNYIGTYNLLEATKKYSKRFHFVSTDEVFGELGNIGKFSETLPYNPRSPYAATKAAADHLVRAYINTYNIAATISNCTNNYGPYQHCEKMIPLFITNLLNGKNIPIYGTGKNIRDWVHVLDHVKALDLIIHNGKLGETYCIGGNTELENIEVAKIIIKEMNKSEDNIEYVTDRLGHDFRYAIDFSKIQNELGWQPTIKFSDGIKDAISWYKKEANCTSTIETNVESCNTQRDTIGILLVGGTGSRLYPSSKVTNKHLLNVYDKPMIDYSLKTLVDHCIDNIIVVSSTDHIGTIIKYLTENPIYKNICFTFKAQTEPDGIAGALMLCKHMLCNKEVYVVLGDNIYETPPQTKGACCVVLKKVANPEQFGVAVLEQGKITKIIEKPKEFISDFAVTGFYKFDHRLSFFLENLKKSNRAEYEISDILNKYIQADGKLNYIIYDKFWSDAGTPKSLHACAIFFNSLSNLY